MGTRLVKNTGVMMDYLLFDLGLALLIKSASPYLGYIDVVLFWVFKPFTLLVYPFYWMLGCNMEEIHEVLIAMKPFETVNISTVRLVDNYCRPNDVLIFMCLVILVCASLVECARQYRQVSTKQPWTS